MSGVRDRAWEAAEATAAPVPDLEATAGEPIDRKGFRWRWEHAFRDARIARLGNPSTVAVGFALASYASADGTSIRPSRQTIADGLGVSVSTVQRGIDRLKALGWIARDGSEPEPGEKAPHRPVEYRLTIGTGSQMT